MSLFGGDTPRESDSSFSITPIASPRANERNQPSSRLSSEADTRSAPLEGYGSLSPIFSEGYAEIRESDAERQEKQNRHSRSRFPGTDSRWKSYVKEEISLAASLADLRADDLAAHLYNAHAWKQALRTPVAAVASLPFASKSGWIVSRDSAHAPWYPKKSWTEWPLEPDLVPAREESLWTRRTEIREATPLADLASELTAVALNRIGSQWSSRPDPSRLWSRSTANTPMRSVSRSTTPSVRPSSRDLSPFSTEGPDSNTIRPVLSADDDRSHRILRPSVTSALSRLDNLLIALHHNRAGHYADARTDAALRLRIGSHSRSRSRSSIRTLHRRQTSSDGRHHSSSESDEVASRTARPTKRRKFDRDQSQTDRGRGRSRSRQRSRSGDRSASADSDGDAPVHLQPRDWSEIVGLAALTGWHPDVIKQTVTRCSLLFKEKMDFTVSMDQEQEQGPSAHPTSAATTVPTFFCPEKDCIHHESGYVESQAHRFRDHLKRSHAYSMDMVTEAQVLVDAPLKVAQPLARSNPRGWKVPDPPSCPFSDCKQSRRIYHESRRLVEHLIRTHKWDPRVASPPAEMKEQREAHNAKAEPTDLTFGVHNDGYLELI